MEVYINYVNEVRDGLTDYSCDDNVLCLVTGVRVDFDVYINDIKLTGMIFLNRDYRDTNISELKEIIKEKLKQDNS